MQYLFKEYLNFDLSKDKIKQEPAITQIENVKEFDYSTIGTNNVYEIEAIHGYPLATRNFTRYMPEALRGCIESWTKPYPRPLIKFHNDIDGETIGRIIEATYIENSPSTNTPAIKVKAAIGKQEAIQDIENNVLLTVSIGTGVSDCRCSICGEDYFNSENCTHIRGQAYDGQTCYIDIYKMEARELSFVIVPSDPYAMLVQNNKFFNPFSKEQDDKVPKIEHRKEKQEKLEKIEEQQEFIDLKAAKEAVEQTLQEKENTIETLNASIQEKDAQIEQLNASLQEKESQLETKSALLESAENSLTETEKEMKAIIVDTIESYRSILKKREIDKDTYLNRTVESLQDTVKDLKEELSYMVPQKIVNKESLVDDGEIEPNKKNEKNELSIEERFAQMF